MLLLAQIAQQEGNQQALQTYKQQLTELDSDELELLNPSN
jgi:Tfp pilus assembly protein PilF